MIGVDQTHQLHQLCQLFQEQKIYQEGNSENLDECCTHCGAMSGSGYGRGPPRYACLYFMKITYGRASTHIGWGANKYRVGWVFNIKNHMCVFGQIQCKSYMCVFGQMNQCPGERDGSPSDICSARWLPTTPATNLRHCQNRNRNLSVDDKHLQARFKVSLSV